MVGRKWLSPSKKVLICSYRLSGLSMEQIARRMGVNKSTVIQSIKHSLHHSHDCNTKPSGRPKTVSERHKRLVLHAIFENPFATWVEVLKTVEGVSLSTLKKIARAKGIRCNVALRKPALSAKNIRDRRQWAEDYKDQDWCQVIYTDECSIVIGR